MKTLAIILFTFLFHFEVSAAVGQCNSKKGMEAHQKFCESQKKPACEVQNMCVWQETNEKYRAAFIAKTEWPVQGRVPSSTGF